VATTASSGTYAAVLIILSGLSASAGIEVLYWLIGVTALAIFALLLILKPKVI
jgi:Na+/proline symporter